MRPQIEKPEMQNSILDQTGLAKPGKSHGLPGRGPVLDSQEATGLVGFLDGSRSKLNHFSVLNLDHQQVTQTHC